MSVERRQAWAALAARTGGVVERAQACAVLGEPAVRWAVRTGRAQAPDPGLVVLHNGPLTSAQLDLVAVLAAGPGAALGGTTAASRLGLRLGEGGPRHVVIPRSRRARPTIPGAVVHWSRLLGPDQVLTHRRPALTRLERSVVDGARWAATDDGARAVLAAAVQQRLTTAGRLRAQLETLGRCHRAGLIRSTLADVEGGSHTVPEADFLRAVRRAGLPEPERQVLRQRADGRWYLDVRWAAYRVTVEIDGAGHDDLLAREADQARDNALTADGERVLRFSNHAVRTRPDEVVALVRRALLAAGWPG